MPAAANALMAAGPFFLSKQNVSLGLPPSSSGWQTELGERWARARNSRCSPTRHQVLLPPLPPNIPDARSPPPAQPLAWSSVRCPISGARGTTVRLPGPPSLFDACRLVPPPLTFVPLAMRNSLTPWVIFDRYHIYLISCVVVFSYCPSVSWAADSSPSLSHRNCGFPPRHIVDKHTHTYPAVWLCISSRYRRRVRHIRSPCARLLRM
ncbi:hypothetical protein LZ31DRAFT_76534 [Colletotrichum somersetense]|nr:hypothetical protein LZ31DRAFT_76534 [Colletotrichum somersetense]